MRNAILVMALLLAACAPEVTVKPRNSNYHYVMIAGSRVAYAPAVSTSDSLFNDTESVLSRFQRAFDRSVEARGLTWRKFDVDKSVTDLVFLRMVNTDLKELPAGLLDHVKHESIDYLILVYGLRTETKKGLILPTTRGLKRLPVYALRLRCGIFDVANNRLVVSVDMRKSKSVDEFGLAAAAVDELFGFLLRNTGAQPDMQSH